MARNYSIGIDLGTTNSEIAVFSGGVVEIVKNIYGDEYTPSVFGIDKGQNFVVGKKAYERLFRDASGNELQNNRAEIKRLMGTDQKIHFDRSAGDLDPEQISAEILKSLLADAKRKFPELDSDSAVVTIPAAFSMLQAEATKRAAFSAGLKNVLLLQEPIAAAFAFGFNKVQGGVWIVYDLGGGTFDVALVSSRDGIITVLGHAGDNFLGGKNFDWEIVEKILIPRIALTSKLADFHRGNLRHASLLSRLKFFAEQAKIQLSHSQDTLVEIENVGDDDEGKAIEASFKLTRGELESIFAPLIQRTLDLTIEAMTSSGVSEDNVDRLVLVGGATQMPWVHNAIERRFNFKLESSIDPLTAVARGACIYAVGQEVANGETLAVPEGFSQLTLNYPSLSGDTSEMVTGRFESPASSAGWTVQIESDDGSYNSGSIAVKSNGTFLANIVLESGKVNSYWVFAFDSTGADVKIFPDNFQIVQGISVAGAPLPHSVGIVVAQYKVGDKKVTLEERVVQYFERGTTLPTKPKSERFRTKQKLVKGETNNPLWIRIVEGESNLPDRNNFVCDLGIKGADLPRDIPEGTEIEVTLEISLSRELTVEAYFPGLDLRVNARATSLDKAVDLDDVKADFVSHLQRIEKLGEDVPNNKRRNIESESETLGIKLQRGAYDEDEKLQLAEHVRKLKSQLDDLEQAVNLPNLQSELKKLLQGIESQLKAMGKDAPDCGSQIQTFREEGEKAYQAKDRILLAKAVDGAGALYWSLYEQVPDVWINFFNSACDPANRYKDGDEAQKQIKRGKIAVVERDLAEIKACVRSLWALRDDGQLGGLEKKSSGITR